MDGHASRLSSIIAAQSEQGNSTARNSIRDVTATLPESVPRSEPSASYFPPMQAQMANVATPLTPSMNRNGVDPPRPAKDGHEWVWYPEGFWAERELRPETPELSGLGKRFQWRKRSGKGSSSRETETSAKAEHHPSHPSPKTIMDVLGKQPLASPFLTEKDHVKSLQRPSLPRRTTSEESAKEGATYFRLGGPKTNPPSKSSPISETSNEYTPKSLGSSRPQSSQTVVRSPLKVFMRTPESPPPLDTPPVVKPKKTFFGFLSRSNKTV